MPDLMLTVLSLSVSGAMLALCVLLLERVGGRRLSCRFRYYIWLVVILRLLLPFAPESSLLGSFSGRIDSAVAVMEQPEAGEALPPAQVPEDGFAREAAQRPAFTAMAPGGSGAGVVSRGLFVYLAWAGMAAALLCWRLISYWVSMLRLRKNSRRVEDAALLGAYARACKALEVKRAPKLLYNGEISSPMLAGLLRPVILLPEIKVGERELYMVMLHELTHYRRRDGWYKWLVEAAVCVHWFNPAVYLVRGRIHKACELSCDERVLEHLEPGNRMGYGDMLLDVVRGGGRCPAGSLLLGEDARTLKERLAAILQYRPRTRRMVAAAVAMGLAALCSAVLLGAYTSPHGRAYYDDAIVAGQDVKRVQEQSGALGQDNTISYSVGGLNGASSLLVLDINRETELAVDLELGVSRGLLKVSLVSPEGQVSTLAEGSGMANPVLTLAPGRYTLKAVGKNAGGWLNLAITEHWGQEGSEPAVATAPAKVPYLEKYSANPHASVSVKSLDHTWSASTTAQGDTLQEQLDSKIAFIEETYREKGGGFVIEEGTSLDELSNVEALEYLYGRSAIYRSLVTAGDSLPVADGSFSILADEGQAVLYDRYVFYLERPGVLELTARYELEQGKTGIWLVTPNGELLYRQPESATAQGTAQITLEETGLWSLVLVNHMEGRQMRGRRVIQGRFLYGAAAAALREQTDTERDYALVKREYEAFGFSIDTMSHMGVPIARYEDRELGLSGSRRARTDDDPYVNVVRDRSVPGPNGYGQILRIDTYSKEEWEAMEEQ